jgi:hypothetical protein
MEHREQIVAHVLLPDGRKVLCPDRATADLIVRTFNSHDAMREALTAAVARVELANAEGNPIMSAWLSDAKAALALANGQHTAK